MFGFLNPRPHSFEYRRVYARLCQHLRRNHGVRSLPFHSYEAIFLYQLALDAGVFPASILPNVKRCRLAVNSRLHLEPDAAVGRFCSAFTLLLASIKLQDDIDDSGSIPAKLANRVLRKPIREASAYFQQLDTRFAANIRQLLADHQVIEKPNQAVSLEEYVQPTSQAFGYVFSQMAKLSGLEPHRELLSKLGHHLGDTIISFDAAIDWKRDRQRGEFNPLAHEIAVQAAWERAIDQLAEAEVLIRDTLGVQTRSGATLAAVRNRLLRLNPLAAVCSRKRIPIYASTREGEEDGEIYSAQPPDGRPTLDFGQKFSDKIEADEKKSRWDCWEANCCGNWNDQNCWRDCVGECCVYACCWGAASCCG